MSITKILNSLEESWERNDILLKLKNGLDTDEIVNEFLANNEIQIKKLNTLLRPEDFDLLNQVEKLSNCESKLINKIKNLESLEKNKDHQIINQSKISLSNSFSHTRISSIMINWSNRFVVVALLTISAIALSKQAWA
ncbi:MAG: competence protein ComC [Prochlorococcus marinus CUG1431]|uniref:Competence protein ComC n=1 Tax=Prochlorococcus marinus CUG1433 TaxID=2774506 RepID=A0A9D9BVD9_PROMR|nr:competence protein ComC [Prochlorococcus marinus CUG1433]MBO6980752.1 competence protein ComC [Prochlorococcus marinus CUG1431]